MDTPVDDLTAGGAVTTISRIHNWTLGAAIDYNRRQEVVKWLMAHGGTVEMVNSLAPIDRSRLCACHTVPVSLAGRPG